MTYLSNHLPIRCVTTLAMHLHCIWYAFALHCYCMCDSGAFFGAKSCPKVAQKLPQNTDWEVETSSKVPKKSQLIIKYLMQMHYACYAFALHLVCYIKEKKRYIYTHSHTLTIVRVFDVC